MAADVWALSGSATPADVLRALRGARRRRRLVGIRWLDVLFNVYATVLVGGILFSFAVDIVSGIGISVAGAGHVTNERTAAAAGVVLMTMVLLGTREGRLGGPLALEPAHVRHVLWSPIDRGRALRGPIARTLVRRAITGGASGAAVGIVLARSFAGPTLPVIAGSATCAAAASLLAAAAAVLASHKARPWWPLGLAVVLVAWSLADAIAATHWSPATELGRLAVGPQRSATGVVVAAVMSLVAIVVALTRVGFTSIELSERRAALVALVRFSVTTQDLRSVIVLRRLLTLEIPRRRPWLRIDPWAPTALPSWRRGWHGLLRWPAGRITRCVVLGLLAGAAVAGAWQGTTLLLAVAGIAIYITALDVVEPVAQEDDHPQLRDMQPVAAEQLAIRLLSAPVAALGLVATVAAVGSVVTAVLSGSADTVTAAALGVLVVVPVALGGAAGAMWSLMRKPPDPWSPQYLAFPETFGAEVARHYTTPIILASAGFLPVLAARLAERAGANAMAAGAIAAAAVAGLLGTVLRLITVRASKKGKHWND